MWNIKHVWFLTRPQPTTTDPYRRSGTKQIFQTDPQKPLIGSLSRVVEHPHYVVLVMWWDPNIYNWPSFRFVDWSTLDPSFSQKLLDLIFSICWLVHTWSSFSQKLLWWNKVTIWLVCDQIKHFFTFINYLQHTCAPLLSVMWVFHHMTKAPD